MFGKLLALFSAASVVTATAESLYDVQLKTLVGDKQVSLADYKGKVLMIVNVASKCGLTKQYSELEALQKKYAQQRFTVLGMPCNQFGKQEPGTAEQIQTFCSATYGVSFPMFEKIEVNGPNRHPLYTVLAGEGAAFPGKIQWNFTKFLVGKDGKVVARFSPRTKPSDPKVVAAIEAALQ